MRSSPIIGLIRGDLNSDTSQSLRRYPLQAEVCPQSRQRLATMEVVGQVTLCHLQQTILRIRARSFPEVCSMLGVRKKQFGTRPPMMSR